ncbi:MAG: 2-oxo acid dehydrogenase subunit E2, partial [Actinobacteria bacterium]|nr:2-oxo acid dehydrogenase subunit E2 [Actinomycetota bacterium]
MPDEQPSTFGPNAWLVDEMYDQYRQDPQSVSESWQEFFADYRREDATNGATAGDAAAAAPAQAVLAPPRATAAAPASRAAAAKTPAVAPADATAPKADREDAVGEPIRGAGARVVANMEASLAVPTATSVRPVPAKLLEVNRRIANNHLTRTRGGKLSFTHLIGYAVVQALKTVPALNNSYVERDGKPFVVRNRHVGLGLAVDVVKSDGSRTLLVPVIKGAEAMDFRRFWDAYEDVVRRVKTNKMVVDDFAGATVTLTNPGTIGTVSSVPRLMPGQGAIIGVGALAYPVEYSGADPATLAEMGISKVVTLTSTYDHRIIQGAESGLFLQRVADLLTGKDGFYDEIFRSLAVPYESVVWRQDHNPVDAERTRLEKQVHVQSLINMYRVRGHL